MVWRAPGLKTNTLLITNKLPFQYYSDNSLTAPLNWTYAPDFQGENIPYYLAFTEVRLGRSLAALEEGLEVRQAYRTTHFDSTTSDALVFYYAPPGCLRILDPEQEPYLPVLPDELQEALAISHPAQIVLDAASPASPPQEIFGSEPAHTWCYYFEQADLARQRGDWQQVVRIGDQVLDQGYLPAELSECWCSPRLLPHRSGQTRRRTGPPCIRQRLASARENLQHAHPPRNRTRRRNRCGDHRSQERAAMPINHKARSFFHSTPECGKIKV